MSNFITHRPYVGRPYGKLTLEEREHLTRWQAAEAQRLIDELEQKQKKRSPSRHGTDYPAPEEDPEVTRRGVEKRVVESAAAELTSRLDRHDLGKVDDE
ncbi:MAG: hypothetical protein EON54_03840 [Alcaligenaceae bacterium]|nr:MAG: hypothetical protein EON54_03840 [Alcaligenaceae bacterium]